MSSATKIDADARSGLKFILFVGIAMSLPFLLLRLPISVTSFTVARSCRRRARRGFTAPNDGLSSSQVMALSVNTIFDLSMPEGRCVGVQLDPDLQSRELRADMLSIAALSREDHWIRTLMHPDEVAYCIRLQSDSSRKSFLLGRIALRRSLVASQQEQGEHALERLCNNQNYVLLKDSFGRPAMPSGFLGSISHKGDMAVGLVCRSLTVSTSDSPLRAIGVDLERRNPAKQSIGRRILTHNEQLNLGKVANLDCNEEVMLRFSVKEALYKAMHPLLCRYIGFREAEAQPNEDGTFDISLNLHLGEHERFGLVQAHWRRQGEFFLTSAVVGLNERHES